MKVYITGASAITPQNTFDPEAYLKQWIEPGGKYYVANEPAYKGLIDPKMSRRMGKIIKMSMAVGKGAMAAAGIRQPGAIIVGTGLGCISDTEKFLIDIIDGGEETLSPTPFIQSTHNTIAGQLALSIGCKEDNLTYVNRGHSFENALLDAILRIKEGTNNVLLGGVDEITPTVYNIMSKMHCNNNIIPGEGSCFFVLSDKKKNQAVCIEDLFTFNNTSVDQLSETLKAFLAKNHLHAGQIDALLLGVPEGKSDEYCDAILKSFKGNIPIANFKKVSGEYFTASAYAYQLGTMMLLKQQLFPVIQISGKKTGTFNRVLIYNHYSGVNHTLSLLSL